MTSTHLSPPTVEGFGRSPEYSSYLDPNHDGHFVANRNAIPRAYVAPNTSSLDSDFVMNDKLNPESSFEWQKSPSGHSVASSTTSDSGFQSVTMLTNGTLNRSPNSAFSPRIRSDPKDKLDSSEAVSDFQSSLHFDGYYRSSSPVDDDASFVKTRSESPTTPTKEAPLLSYDRDEDDTSYQQYADSYQRVSSYSTMPRSLRRKKFAAQRSPRNADNKASHDSSFNSTGAYSGSVNINNNDDEDDANVVQVAKPATKIRSDALLKNFIQQAEERDKKARREQRTLTRTGRPRTKSASAYRTGNVRSSSVGSDNRGFATIRRSNSSVDLKDIIHKAESRDRHARVEQARLEGLLPPRRHIPAKEPVKVMKIQPASSIITKFEDMKQPDDPFLKHANESGGRSRTGSFSHSNYGQGYVSGTHSEYAGPTNTQDAYRPFRTAQVSYGTKKSPSSIHSDAGVNYSIARYTPRYREHRAKLGAGNRHFKKGTTFLLDHKGIQFFNVIYTNDPVRLGNKFNS